MTNNLKNEKGGKYTQKFYEKLGKASLNTDAISSLVLQDKKYEKMPADFCGHCWHYYIYDNIQFALVDYFFSACSTFQDGLYTFCSNP